MLGNFHHQDLCTDGSFLQSLVTGSSKLLLSAYPLAIRAYAACPPQHRDRTRQSFPAMTTQVEEENSCVLSMAHPVLPVFCFYSEAKTFGTTDDDSSMARFG